MPGTIIYADKELVIWETLEVFSFDVFTFQMEWTPALSMIPGSKLYQQHYDSLPDEFKSGWTVDAKQKVL